MVHPPLTTRIYHCHITTNISTSKHLILRVNIQYEVVYVHKLRLQIDTNFCSPREFPQGKSIKCTWDFLGKLEPCSRPGSYRDPTGIPLGSYRDPTGILPWSHRDPAGIPLESYWDPTGILLGSHWDPAVIPPWSCRGPTVILPGSHWNPTGIPQGSSWDFTGILPGSHWDLAVIPLAGGGSHWDPAGREKPLRSQFKSIKKTNSRWDNS